MNDMDEVLKQLRDMPRAELITMANEFKPPVTFKKTWNVRQIAAAVRKRQLADNPPKEQPKAAEPIKTTNDEFLELTAGIEAEKIDGRGGPREGAGRPPGMTNEKAAVARLPQLPNESVVAAFRMLFAAWEASVKVEGVAITEEEARSMALPVTQLIEFYCPGQIPEIAWTWVMAVWSVGSVTMLRIKLIKAVKDAKPKPVESVEVVPDAGKTGQ